MMDNIGKIINSLGEGLVRTFIVCMLVVLAVSFITGIWLVLITGGWVTAIGLIVIIVWLCSSYCIYQDRK
jgi:hypothetical protein